ncbi:MAG: DNA polymerase III subunit alpha [Flavobacteriales bacterium]
MYINTHTYFSFKYGTLTPEELLGWAQELGITQLAVTDINNTSAVMHTMRIAKKYGVEVTHGVDFRNGAKQMYVALAKNEQGFYEINKHLSHHLENELPFDMIAPADKMENTIIIYPFSLYSGRALHDNEFIGIAPSDLNRLRFSPLLQQKEKLVALQTVSFRKKTHFKAHQLLRAIDNNTIWSKLDKEETGKPNHIMLAAKNLFEVYIDFSFLVENAQQLLSSCHMSMEWGEGCPSKNQRSFYATESEDIEQLRELCYDGFAYRYANRDEKIIERIEKELSIIQEKGFVSYFLINHEIVSYARSKGYFYVGRGSGANSVVAYLLRITDVDPIELDLYFERFINLYRRNPPDFDIDFSSKDREDVTRHIFERFPNVTLLATYNTFQRKSLIRELGKVFGLPPHEIENISRDKNNDESRDHIGKTIRKYSAIIENFPSHLSVHAGGILISDKPIHHYTATSKPPKGYPLTHFDMHIAEDIGLYKFDILGQRGLGKIKDAVDIIHENNPTHPRIDINDINRFKEDEKVKDLLRKGNAIGCFYVESPGMRMLMSKLEVDDYLGLVAASSIIRPGVASSGMMREYILRHRNIERRKEAHPVLADIMPETYGVMVYQEDVIKVAHMFADLSLAEADVLRRGMSGKFRSREEFQQVEEKFYFNCLKKGYSHELTKEVWRQIESFAGYAFSKGHSASYAVESFQSLFLKAHYPIEFMAAVLNNGGGFYHTELYVHEARMHGAHVESPCINTSGHSCTVNGKNIWLGLAMIAELEVSTIGLVLEERTRHGAFSSLRDLIRRVPLSSEQLHILIRAGALRFTQQNKKELMWEACLYGKGEKKQNRMPELFSEPARTWTLPELSLLKYEDAFDQMEMLGFPLCSPFDLTPETLPRSPMATGLHKSLGKEVTVYGYMITVKKTRTVKGQDMAFGTFIDQNGHFIDTVHFPTVAATFPFRGRGVYAIRGKVTEEFGYYSIEVNRMEKINYMTDPRYAQQPVKSKKAA